MAQHSKLPVVFDVGSGCTKIGFAGNLKPSHVFPTAVAMRSGARGEAVEDFVVGPSVDQRGPLGQVESPVRKGVITDWSLLEKLIYGSLNQWLQVDSRKHPMLFTEPPRNPPENREWLAETVFETFGMPALYLANQAVLSLYGMHARSSSSSEVCPCEQPSLHPTVTLPDPAALTGTVVDAGDGATHIVPIVNGYMVRPSIQSSEIAGGLITNFVRDSLLEHGEPLPRETATEVARAIKERYSYTCRDVVAEQAKLLSNESKVVRRHIITLPGGETRSVKIAAERFLAPEVFFSPDLVSSCGAPLQQLVDAAIQECSIDSRRNLYGNVVICGGSAGFQYLDRRLKQELQKRVDERLTTLSTGVRVRVSRHPHEVYASWLGGSLLAAGDNFVKLCWTKADYEECGPGVVYRLSSS